MSKLSQESSLFSAANNPSEVPVSLIDVLGFAWRSRKTVILCGLLGFVCAGLFWLSSLPRGDSLPSNFLIRAELVTGPYQDESLSKATEKIIEYLSKPEGAQTFFAGIQQADFARKLDFTIDRKKQLSNQGLIRELSFSNGRIILFIHNARNWNEAQLKIALPLGMNSVARQMNLTRENMQISLRSFERQAYQLRSELAAIKLQVIKLFDRKSALSTQGKQAVIASIVENLVRSRDADVILFLLSEVPSDNQEKQELLASFREYNHQSDLLDLKIKSIMNSIQSEVPVEMPSVSSVDVLEVSRRSSGTPLERLSTSLFATLLLGTILASMLGFCFAIIWKTVKRIIE